MKSNSMYFDVCRVILGQVWSRGVTQPVLTRKVEPGPTSDVENDANELHKVTLQ